MLLRPRRQNQVTPTFLEGTPGRYVKRESPPVLPSINGMGVYLRKKSKERKSQTETTNIKRTQSVERSKILQSNPSSSNPHLPNLNFQSPNFNSIPIEIDQQQNLQNLHRLQNVQNFTPEPVDMQQQSGSNQAQNLARQLFMQQNAEHQPVKRHQSVKETMLTGTYRRKAQQAQNEMQSSDYAIQLTKYPHAASAGGSVMSLPENFLQPNYRVSNTEQAQDQNSRDFVSSGLSMVDPASVVNQLLDDTHLFEEPPLPNNWAVEVTEQGFRYYVDHNNRRTHWIHPLLREPLPPGWTKIFDEQHGVLYYNELERKTQFDHPGIATSPSFDDQPMPATNNTSTSALSNASNYTTQGASSSQQLNMSNSENMASTSSSSTPALAKPKAASMQHLSSDKQLDRVPQEALQQINDVEGLKAFFELCEQEIPEFLRIYSQAPSGFDHMLELEEYSSMLMSLYKRDIQKSMIYYDAKFAAINQEIEKREAAAKLQSLTNSVSRIQIHNDDHSQF